MNSMEAFRRFGLQALVVGYLLPLAIAAFVRNSTAEVATLTAVKKSVESDEVGGSELR
jgi:hypothetical protein